MEVVQIARHVKNWLRRHIVPPPKSTDISTLANNFIMDCLQSSPQLSLLARDEFGHLIEVDQLDDIGAILKRGQITDAYQLMRRMEAIGLNGNIAIDVGANRGVVTTFLARRFKIVHSFEPNTLNRVRLKKTIELNKIQNVTVHNEALSESMGTATLHIFSGHGHHSLADVRTSTKIGMETVPTATLDSFIQSQKFPHVDFVKIDTEGFELEVLRGAHETLSEQRIDVIAFEVAPSILAKRRIEVGAVVYFLQRYGYKCFDLEGNVVQSAGLLKHGDYLALAR